MNKKVAGTKVGMDISGRGNAHVNARENVASETATE